ncbi:MAG: hypothetical protein ACJASL_001605 [Paraglaciecola sp.]|jgi:hypothetical protein
MTYHAPSQRRQDWTTILTMALLTFIVSLSSLLYFSWDIGTNWPSLSSHLAFLSDAFIEFVLYRDLSTFDEYRDYITTNKLQTHFALHLCLPSFLALSLAIYVAWHFYVPGGIDGMRHIAGAKLYHYRAAIAHAKMQLRAERKAHKQTGLALHPLLTITRNRENGNLFVSGSQGSGKTVFITPQIQQVIDRGERCFIYDEKREFTSLFYQSESTILIAPWDSRSQAWNIQADACNATQAQLIAEKLILDSNDPLWSNGARMIWVGMVETLNHTKTQWGWAELAEILSADEASLQQHLQQYYPRAARFIVEQSKTTQSFFAQLIGSLGWIFTLADAWPSAYQNGFSMKLWVDTPSTDKPVIIVQADKRYANIGAPLANALIALMTANILSQTNSSQRELWLFLDELANLPRNDALFDWMSLGRIKGCRLIAGTQSIAQLKQIYTADGADSLLAMFTMFVSMRVGGLGETSSYAAQAFGEREVERPNQSTDSKSTTWQRENIPLVTPSNLVQLPQPNRRGVEGFLLIPGYEAVYRLRWPYPKLMVLTDEHCPACWLKANKNKAVSDKKSVSRREQLRKQREQTC